MANVIISAFSNVTFTKEKFQDSFVQGFINVLLRMGNNVMSIYGNDLLTGMITPYIPHKEAHEHFMDKVKKFKPDLIITFNHYFPCKELITETNCPIVVYVSDGCDLFAFPELIKKYIDRYTFLKPCKGIYDNMKAYMPFVKESQYCDFGYATDFRRMDIEQDVNISFLGSIPTWHESVHDHFLNNSSNEDKDRFFAEMEKLRKDPSIKMNYVLPEVDKFKPKFHLETVVLWMMTVKERFMVLSELCDLGIRIQGFKKAFVDCGMINYELLKAFNYDICVTQEQSQLLFNRSKISLNLPNARNTTGVSWRVPDIFASQSVLLSNRMPDIDMLMKGYIDMPQYESPIEARELAQKLLNDDKWRQDISLASNKMVEDKCRFEPKIENIASHTGVNLKSDKEGELMFVSKTEMYETVPWLLEPKKVSEGEKVLREISKLLPFFIAEKIIKKLTYETDTYDKLPLPCKASKILPYFITKKIIKDYKIN